MSRLAVVALCALGTAAQAEPAPTPLHSSSIGQVVPASGLPGKIGAGYLVFQKWCAGCHAAEYAPPAGEADKLSPISRLPLATALLQQRYKGAVPAALEQRADLSPALVGALVRRGVNAMPPFRRTEISDSELDALAAYLARNAQ